MVSSENYNGNTGGYAFCEAIVGSSDGSASSGTEDAFTGLRLGADGNWYYYVNGEVDRSYNGLYCDANVGWWLVACGRWAGSL